MVVMLWPISNEFISARQIHYSWAADTWREVRDGDQLGTAELNYQKNLALLEARK